MEVKVLTKVKYEVTDTEGVVSVSDVEPDFLTYEAPDELINQIAELVKRDYEEFLRSDYCYYDVSDSVVGAIEAVTEYGDDLYEIGDENVADFFHNEICRLAGLDPDLVIDRDEDEKE